MFQHVAKKSFNIFALSLSLVVNVPSEHCRGGMVSRFLFKSFTDFQKVLVSAYAMLLINFCLLWCKSYTTLFCIFLY